MKKNRGKLIRKTYAAVTKILGVYQKCQKKKNHSLLQGYIVTRFSKKKGSIFIRYKIQR